MQRTTSQQSENGRRGAAEQLIRWKATTPADDDSRRPATTPMDACRPESTRWSVEPSEATDDSNCRPVEPLHRLPPSAVDVILASIATHVVVLNEHGSVTFVSRPEWCWSIEQCPLTGPGLSVGANYLDICRNVRAETFAAVPQITKAVLDVLDGDLDLTKVEYCCMDQDDGQWLVATVTSLPDEFMTAAVVLHEDITAQRHYESSQEAKRAMEGQLAGLSKRERQVLTHVIEGKANKVIAYELDLSPKTVEKHRASVMRKLRTRNAAQLVRLVVSSGIRIPIA